MTEPSTDGVERGEVLGRALDTWGEEAQIVMAIEECAELQQALTRLYRGRADDEDVIEEIADVQIMLDQLGLIFGCGDVAHAEQQKLERLSERLDAETEVSGR